jgi:tetratricopeptide (TPR) repeat protein
VARAFHAYLAQQGRSEDMRRNAQLSLVFSLSQAKLDYTALAVMRASGVPAAQLDPAARYLLGTIAAKRNEPALALELWQGLQTPANVRAEDWQLTLARTALDAGKTPVALEAVQRLLAPERPAAESIKGAFDLANDMLALRKLAEARALYEALAAGGGESRRREALFGLGRVHDSTGEPQAAADAYLRSALLSTAPDTMAVQARLRAAVNLARAGLEDDARAQFRWVLKHAKDPSLVDSARRGLERL